MKTNKKKVSRRASKVRRKKMDKRRGHDKNRKINISLQQKQKQRYTTIIVLSPNSEQLYDSTPILFTQVIG
jgi:hypothetical protein